MVEPVNDAPLPFGIIAPIDNYVVADNEIVFSWENTSDVDNSEISITWDTGAKSKYDGLSRDELFELNYKGWASKLNLQKPSVELLEYLKVNDNTCPEGAEACVYDSRGNMECCTSGEMCIQGVGCRC